MTDNYDIFISYRRDGGAQYARILQLELEKRGYRVFLDYEELTDGVFGDNIKKAIHQAPIFMMVLSEHYLDRCKNEGDWVREEITLAIKENKHFIPVNPDNLFDGIPADIPEEIKSTVRNNQRSEVRFGQLLRASVDEMVEKRVAVHVQRSEETAPQKHDIVIETPPKKHGIVIAAAACLLAIVIGIGVYFLSGNSDSSDYQKSYDEVLVNAANKGDAKAQYYLGLVYANGYGTPSNASAAVGWYRRAAEQGLDSAQILLGLCYLEGTGITQDEKEGVRWLKTAAENGNTDAIFNLGVYFFQKGDEKAGTEWLRIAAEQGHEQATEFLKEIGG